MLDFVEKQKTNDTDSLMPATENSTDASEAFITGAINGDERAFTALINHYYADILSIQFSSNQK